MCMVGVAPGSSSSVATRRMTCGCAGWSATRCVPHSEQKCRSLPGRLHAAGGGAGDAVCRHVRKGQHRTDVDLAQDERALPGRVRFPQPELGIPDRGQKGRRQPGMDGTHDSSIIGAVPGTWARLDHASFLPTPFQGLSPPPLLGKPACVWQRWTMTPARRQPCTSGPRMPCSGLWTRVRCRATSNGSLAAD